MEVLPCSRVAHIERTRKPYNNDIDYYAKRNALRAAEVWMDSFKSHVYMAWNIPMTVSWRGTPEMSYRQQPLPPLRVPRSLGPACAASHTFAPCPCQDAQLGLLLWGGQEEQIALIANRQQGSWPVAACGHMCVSVCAEELLLCGGKQAPASSLLAQALGRSAQETACGQSPLEVRACRIITRVFVCAHASSSRALESRARCARV